METANSFDVSLYFQFSLGNLDAKRDWGHAKDYVEVSILVRSLSMCYNVTASVFHSKRDFQSLTAKYRMSGIKY